MDAPELGLPPDSRYAVFWRPTLSPLPALAREAVLAGARPAELLWPAGEAARLLDEGDWPIETGWTVTGQGEGRVFCRTLMPGVTPAMWDWWFGWHGSEAERYRLWHPQAHVSATWADSRGDTGGYVGRTSRVVEYLGAQRMGLTIRFTPPGEVGLDADRLKARGEVAICARGGLDGAPVESGVLIHHLRPTRDGCEMRSRFWLFGPMLRPRPGSGLAGALATGLARRLAKADARQAEDLLVHCAQEMNHLAAFLPDLSAAFGGPR